MAVWTVKGGRQGEREARLLEHGLLGGGWELLPSLAGVADTEQLAALYADAYPDVPAKAASNYVGQLWSLVHRMQNSELVVLPLKTTGTAPGSSRPAPGRGPRFRIRAGKDTGLGRFPSRLFAINAAWLAVVLLAADLIAWTQTLLLADQPELTRTEPKTLRYRLLHVAARLTRGGRRRWLRIQASWP